MGFLPFFFQQEMLAQQTTKVDHMLPLVVAAQWDPDFLLDPTRRSSDVGSDILRCSLFTKMSIQMMTNSVQMIMNAEYKNHFGGCYSMVEC